ncbi:MAG TPA: phosphonate ABC transporter, permease protein PhnE [Sphaerochaeta sp.]|jgi:phosphonate transport system permease protein|nr:MAG: phosphonate ABC transporter, permease protein PhnE [Spirochaetes bacterium GWC2_52_13]PKL13034.1 MAG: phosphonate ABC transporter, permease protein PhnE [Spirochaetae bacterium HGW-Spirochaetae-8]PKL21703.1 MAG: phosphonate ABC transporter, permease protein PhnE [Spirochaetae bacterium HGW-Spirochaetae-4]HCG64535.1 phosphonate ABC transporter, permease protein PhnE [Sphaerochaeta sp.]HCJ95359.1 phosphonate ABC transporter, permease protein PhnE [Sphaerochaeta sp.]
MSSLTSGPLKELGKESYHWERFTAKQRFLRFIAYLTVAVLLYWTVSSIDIYWPWVWSAPIEIQDMISRMIPPNPGALPEIIPALIETINIATIGTVFAVLISLPVAYFGASNVSPNKVMLWIARVIIVSSRSIDTLIWALLFVAILGPGPMAGVFAVTFRAIGFLAKLIGESIEEMDWGPVEALQSSGASKAHIISYAIVPQVLPTFWAVTILRWDINIRESTVLGMVGAGGIGMLFQVAIDLFRWRDVSMVLFSIILVVLFGEIVTSIVRKKLI